MTVWRRVLRMSTSTLPRSPTWTAFSSSLWRSGRAARRDGSPRCHLFYFLNCQGENLKLESFYERIILILLISAYICFINLISILDSNTTKRNEWQRRWIVFWIFLRLSIWTGKFYNKGLYNFPKGDNIFLSRWCSDNIKYIKL